MTSRAARQNPPPESIWTRNGAVPKQIGHWLGVMSGHARVGLSAQAPTGEVLNMVLPVAPGGFIQGAGTTWLVKAPREN